MQFFFPVNGNTPGSFICKVFSHVYILMQPAKLCAYIFHFCLKCIVYRIGGFFLFFFFSSIHGHVGGICIQILKNNTCRLFKINSLRRTEIQSVGLSMNLPGSPCFHQAPRVLTPLPGREAAGPGAAGGLRESCRRGEMAAVEPGLL